MELVECHIALSAITHIILALLSTCHNNYMKTHSMREHEFYSQKAGMHNSWQYDNLILFSNQIMNEKHCLYLIKEWLKWCLFSLIIPNLEHLIKTQWWLWKKKSETSHRVYIAMKWRVFTIGSMDISFPILFTILYTKGTFYHPLLYWHVI